MSWKKPVPYPTITASITAELVARDSETPEKAQAFDTPFRFSGVLDCARKLALRAAGFEPSNPMDGSSLLVTTRGTLMHEFVQDAIAKRFPNAKFELKGIIEDLLSGHCDALIEIEGVLVIWELKNKGAYAFDEAVGLQRKGKNRGRKTPQGPALSAVVQGGMNAIAHGAEAVIIAYISNEAVSMQLAAEIGMSNEDRIMAEWYVPRAVWEPLALAEIERLKVVKFQVDNGTIPAAQAIDDHGHPEDLDPNAGWVHWRCWYCSHKDLCKQLPRQAVSIKSVLAQTGMVAV